MKRYKIKRKQADGSFVELSLDTSIDSVYRVKDGNIKSLTDILTEEYAPKDNPVFTGSISLGRKEGTTVGEGSFAVGKNLEASGEYSHAEGNGSTVSGNCAHAEGYYNTSSGYCSHVEGYANDATHDYSHAEGYHTTASNTSSHAEGYYTTASGPYSHAEGFHTEASGDYSHVQGKFNIEDAENKYAHIVGNGDINTKSNAHTLDWNGNAWYAGQVEGTNLPYNVSSKALATVSASNIKLGNEITVDNASINKDKRYFIEFLGVKKLCSLMLDVENGNGVICSINNYKIEAYNDSTNIKISISKIDDNTTTDTFTDLIIHEEDNKYLDSKYLETDLILQNSISLGRVGDIGTGSNAVGYMVEASGISSHAEGNSTKASGNFSHAEGNGASTSGDGSHAEGYDTIASGKYSHAEGSGTTASGNYSHAEGDNTTASGESSHAEGSFTIAAGNYSHAEGNGASTSGESSHAEGFYTLAAGNYSHAEGYYTKASSSNQHVQGKYNIEDTANKYAHIVGNGTSNTARANAHTLDWNGNGWYAGKLTVGATPTDDMDVVTKKYMIDNTVNASYVDTKVANLVDSAPETLDTLKELSTALGDDPNFATTVATNIGKKVDKPKTEGTEGQVLSKAADGSNVWVDNGINEDALNTMLTDTFGFVGNTAK